MDKTIYSPDYEVLLRLLKRMRRQAGVTQIELGRRLQETQSNVSKFERGERRLDVLELRTICRVLGVGFVTFIQRLERELAKGA